MRIACLKAGVAILPHELRHAYATHCLNRCANPRAIQGAMGHKSLETTMAYLHAEALSVASPLDAICAVSATRLVSLKLTGAAGQRCDTRRDGMGFDESLILETALARG